MFIPLCVVRAASVLTLATLIEFLKSEYELSEERVRSYKAGQHEGGERQKRKFEMSSTFDPEGPVRNICGPQANIKTTLKVSAQFQLIITME